MSIEKSQDEQSFRYWSAWLNVCDTLFSDTVQIAKLGVQAARQCIKLSEAEEPFIEVTLALRQAQIFHLSQHKGEKLQCSIGSAMPTDTEGSIIASYALAIVRMVNIVTDRDFRESTLAERRKMKSIHNSVRERAAERNLPEELVSLRHDATHATMPSLDELVYGSFLALCYLEAYYWVPMHNKIASRMKSLSHSIHTVQEENQQEKESFATIPHAEESRTLIKEAYPEICARRLPRGRNRKRPDQNFSGKAKKNTATRIQECSLRSLEVPLPPGLL